MRVSQVVCNPCMRSALKKRVCLRRMNESPTCPQPARACVFPDVISKKDGTVNLIKGTGFIVLGIGIGLLAARVYYSPGKNMAVQAPSAAAEDYAASLQSSSDMPTTTDVSRAAGSSARPRTPEMLSRPEADPAQQQADARAALLKLDNRLRSEPVNQKWATEQEATILAAISGDAKDGFPAKLPKDMDAQCRSSLCKVTMTYADEEDAYQMQTKLTLGLRGPISAARTFFSPRADGGMDLTIYAGGQGSLQ